MSFTSISNINIMGLAGVQALKSSTAEKRENTINFLLVELRHSIEAEGADLVNKILELGEVMSKAGNDLPAGWELNPTDGSLSFSRERKFSQTNMISISKHNDTMLVINICENEHWVAMANKFEDIFSDQPAFSLKMLSYINEIFGTDNRSLDLPMLAVAVVTPWGMVQGGRSFAGPDYTWRDLNWQRGGRYPSDFKSPNNRR